MKKILLLKYAKVTDDAFQKLAVKLSQSFEILWADLQSFGSKVNLVPVAELESYLRPYEACDYMVIGDVFWPTGQALCKWSQDKDAKSCFLQHGQWIYTKNKKNPTYTPFMTFLFGDIVYHECQDWPLAKRSQLHVIGSPRYDDVLLSNEGTYVYFSPPVIRESTPGMPTRYCHKHYEAILRLQGIDRETNVLLHPHYRESDTISLRRLFPSAEFVDPEEDPFPLIENASKVLTHRDSTVVLDAIAHGKATVLMNFRGYDWSNYPRNYFKKFAKESNTPEECRQFLIESNTLEYDNDYFEKARDYIYLGNASERIASLLV